MNFLCSRIPKTAETPPLISVALADVPRAYTRPLAEELKEGSSAHMSANLLAAQTLIAARRALFESEERLVQIYRLNEEKASLEVRSLIYQLQICM